MDTRMQERLRKAQLITETIESLQGPVFYRHLDRSKNLEVLSINLKIFRQEFSGSATANPITSVYRTDKIF
jgi:hypothetical protein